MPWNSGSNIHKTYLSKKCKENDSKTKLCFYRKTNIEPLMVLREARTLGSQKNLEVKGNFI